MQLHARLIHREEGRRIVLVWAMEGDRPLGSALGEANSAEEAEDRATARLLQRLTRRGGMAGGPLEPAHPEGEGSVPPLQRRLDPPLASPPAEAEPPDTAGPPEPEPPPEDWSSELAGLDLQLQRLGWDREQEGLYLQRAFGHRSRHRLTVYSDLVAYLRSLETLEPGCDPASAPVPLRRKDLLQQGNQLLERLGWNPEEGRSFLERSHGVSSRQQLSDEQLLRFNMLLESELLGGGA